MAIEVSLAKFDAIASGDHNAGQIDYETTRTGISLKKVNHHVICRSLNKTTIAAERTPSSPRPCTTWKIRSVPKEIGWKLRAIDRVTPQPARASRDFPVMLK